MRIAYFVHGRGRGHASRAQTIVPALTEDGHDLRLFAGDQAIDLLAGLSVAAINSVKPGLRGTLLIPGRLGHDRAELKKSKPDLVISDGDAPSLVAARSLGIRSAASGAPKRPIRLAPGNAWSGGSFLADSAGAQ